MTNGAVTQLYDFANKTVGDILEGHAAGIGPMALADLEGNGTLSLFIGGRVVPGRFPDAPDSKILHSKAGEFHFDADASNAFEHLGMVVGAIWSDLNADGFPELILACEGGPIRVFRLERGKYLEVTESLGLGKYLGLWTGITVGDFDGDGRLDIVAGNWGRNTKYQSYLNRPIHFYWGDPDGDAF